MLPRELAGYGPAGNDLPLRAERRRQISRCSKERVYSAWLSAKERLEGVDDYCVAATVTITVTEAGGG